MSQRNRIACVALAVATLGLGGCEAYEERRDTMTLGVGDSVAFNKATQTISRWPAAAREDRWLSDGARARLAQTRYRTRTVPSPKTLENSGSTEAVPQDQGTAATGDAGK